MAIKIDLGPNWCVNLSSMTDDKKPDFQALVEMMARLRAPDGCPWDREQTPSSLTPYIVEEAYELVEAITEGDPRHVCEELGDLLFQIIFQAQIAAEAGGFDIGDVTAAIHAKMTRRHPHVFGEASVANADEVKRNWVRIKEEQEGRKNEAGALGKVPRSLPALLRARRLTENAAEVGFDWRAWSEVAAKFDEEWAELRAALERGDRVEIEDELGDVLFVLVNLSRFLELDPEATLNRATDKFVRRFQYIEMKVAETGRRLESVPMEEMDRYWDEAKRMGL
jgi:tetrapyrrole methylase family protein / MazG family protein